MRIILRQLTFLSVYLIGQTCFAQTTVFRDTTSQVVTEFDGAPNNFLNTNLSASGVACVGSQSVDRIITSLEFSVSISVNNVPNLGSLDGYDFLVWQVVHPDSFNVRDFEIAWRQGQSYPFAIQPTLFAEPSNEDFSSPYDTSGTYHIYRLVFDKLSFLIPKNHEGHFGFAGLNQSGDGSVVLFQFSTAEEVVDYFDIGVDSRNAVPNPDFPTPFQAYSFKASGEFLKLILGDVNLDGEVDLLDVAPFVELLTNGGFQAEADINQDGVVNLLDVAPFVDLLTGG
ncbi:MAG: dockerin type I repeat-containing protein [Planctomycetota bacterium]